MFTDRYSAGESLGKLLKKQRFSKNTLVIGIPRGGVITALGVAKTIKRPHGIMVVKKIPSPHNPEYAIGAMGEGEVYWDDLAIHKMQISESEKQNLLERITPLVDAREEKIRKVEPKPMYNGKTVVIVDDGVATGATVLCALKVARAKGADVVVLAVPVTSEDTYREIRQDFDSVFTLEIPKLFQSVGEFYKDFHEVSDEEVVMLLQSTHL